MPLMGLFLHWRELKKEISGLEEISTESLRTKRQKEQRMKKKKKTISNDHGKTTHKKINRNDRKRKKVGTEEISK